MVDELSGGALAGKLRDGARLSDGTQVDAAMIASALNRSPWYQPLLDVTSRGDKVVFTPKGRAFDLRAFLGSDRVRFGVQQGNAWLGTGPYRMVEARGEGLVLEANPHHPRQPAIADVVLRGYDPENACGLIQQGLAAEEIDLTAALSREELTDVRGVRKLFAAGTSTAMLWLNIEVLPEALRIAIAKGIDRYRVLATTYENPMAFLAPSLLPPGQGTTRMHLPFERAEAEQMMRELPSPPEAIEMVVVWGRRPYMPDPRAWAAEICQQLEELGVTVVPVHTESLEDYQRRLATGKYGMVLGGWNAISPSPSEFVDALLHSSMLPKGPGSAGCNYAQLQLPRMDDALQAFRSTPSKEHEQALLRMVEETAPVLPLAYGTTSIAARWDLEGIEPSDGAVFDLSKLRWSES
ncbi:MAG: ABC transporter substrate-binding protein [Nannocystaceae bacterium]|nr:ABC transporter substrate-binding protein [bacterium]